MNKLFLFVSIFFAASMFFACSKTKTAQELLREERKAIDRFITENDFKLGERTEMYNKNVYYRTKEGLYINVIDSGNGTKARYGKEEVIVRYDSVFYFKSESEKRPGNTWAGDAEVIFRYGRPDSYSVEGWAIGLSLVSDRARVNLIIPSGLRQSAAQTSFEPIFYENLYYRFK
ncbi:MAG: DUF4827 domain-containing protein [Dysgonamonadaceae bacterium]|jgi:FKBP-type peptidyl-prolyl cis-trans isomerase|nr:DUF4827 domain-containing protein [Dysgonamonadaceae bacterium]